MEEGGGGWVPDPRGGVNLMTDDLICKELDFECGNEGNLEDGQVGFVSQIQEENRAKVVVHDPLASWNGIEFGDLLARADMGRLEPLLDFSSDSVRYRNSRFFLPRSGEVAVDVRTWYSKTSISESQSWSNEEATEVEIEKNLHTDQTQNSAVSITTLGEQPCVEQQIPDLNATPQQKPKRRKHRPKVVSEGKVKLAREEMATVSTPKSTEGTEKRKYVRKKKSDDTDNKTSKRKYVRKKGPPKSVSTGTAEGGEMAELDGSKQPKKSCRKVLDFDSDSQANDNRHQPTPGVKENPIVLSDTDTDQEQQFLNTAGRRIRIQQQQKQKVRGDRKGNYKKLSYSIDEMRQGHMRIRNARYASVRTYQKLSKKGSKQTTACVNLADLVHHNGDEHNSTTSITSSTVTNARNNGKLVKEWWHCNPMAPPSSSTIVRVSISNEKEVTDTQPAQDANAEICSVQDFPSNQTSLDNHIEGEAKPCTTLTASQDRARLARRKRIQKMRQEQNSLRQGVNMQQLINVSHSIPIVSHVDAIWEYLISVDEIVERLKALDINGKTKTSHQRCNALVPFETCYGKKRINDSGRNRREERKQLVVYNHNGTLVPFDSSQNKKRRPRAKVDLDEETSRVWRLLLENINSQGVDGTDEEKARWWENERKVFSGRANSFIARMHLVQGDRRFSKWKGSVVDSVVGVFLTQNVSDHLSSSAFMSLAARFPLKQNPNDEQYHKQGSCSTNAVHVMHPEDSAPLNSDISNDPISDQVSSFSNSEHIGQKAVNSCEGASNSGAMSSTDESVSKISTIGSKQQKYVETIQIELNGNGPVEMSCIEEHQQTQLDDLVSSQSSVTTYQSLPESSASQTGGQDGLYSEINVEFDPADISLPQPYGGSTNFVQLLQMVGCPWNQKGSLRCCNEEGTAKDVQNGVDDIRLHGEFQNEMDRSNDSTSSSVELGVCSIDHGVTDARFDPTEIESLKTPGKKIMPLEVPIDKGNNFNKKALLNRMPTVSKSTTNKGPSAFEGKCNKIHDSSGQKDGDSSSIMAPVDQDHIDVGKRGFRSLSMTTKLTDTMESIKSSKGQKDQASDTFAKKTYSSDRAFYESNIQSLKAKRRRVGKDIDHRFDWEGLRKETQVNGKTRGKTPETMDSLDYEAVRSAEVDDIAYTIRDRGMNNVLAGRIKDFLNRLLNEHGSIDLEWLRDVPPDQAKEYLLSIRGLGLKSVECVRLLTLHHLAFPVDTNVGRIAVRLGWVPLQPLPESLQLHLLEMYPVQESIQKYLWPRLCKLDQKTLYELHYQMITFGKVFCTKSKPNCNSCPMRGECRHFASAFASARLALPGPQEKRIVPSTGPQGCNQSPGQVPEGVSCQVPLLPHIEYPPHDPQDNQSSESQSRVISYEPIIEEPKSPEIECVQLEEKDIEDGLYEESEEIPEIKLNIEEFTQSLQSYLQKNMELEESDVSRALIALTPEAASIPVPKLKNVSMLRTEHHVYELPDSHPLLVGLDKREPDDPCSYLLAIWTPGETADSVQPPEGCTSGETDKLCDKETCFSCNSSREANSHTVRGTLLIPCRTAMRGSFPLNGTYFQVNEVFADHDSSLNPMNIPRKWLWNLPRRTVYFGTSIPTIFKGLSTEGIQQCFWRGYVCVRGFDQKSRAPRPLLARLHFPASKVSRTRGKANGE